MFDVDLNFILSFKFLKIDLFSILADVHLLSDDMLMSATTSTRHRHHRSTTAMYPPIFNVALKAKIRANATCGEDGRDEYCKTADMSQHHQQRSHRSQCSFCDQNSADADKRHLIGYALENNERWWQSPSLYNGKEFEYVTVDLDLGQVSYNVLLFIFLMLVEFMYFYLFYCSHSIDYCYELIIWGSI